MLPVIALVGRPNVGKSTLFNYLTRSREALVADYPGLTRDRQYGRIKRGSRDCLLVDTGGIADDADGIDSFAKRQVTIALEEADVVFFLVDAREGLNVSDQTIAEMLRKLGKPVVLVTNKIDGINADRSNATALIRALKGHPAKVNLIPYNPIDEFPAQRPHLKTVRAFQHQLRQAGIPTTVRFSKGGEIDAACGQLKSATERGRKSRAQIAAEAAG